MMLARIKKAVGWVVVAATLGYLSYVLYRDWRFLTEQQFTPRYEIALFSFLLLIFYIPLLGAVWGIIVKRLGQNIQIRDAMRVRTVGDLARYLPGKVWFFLGRLSLAQKEGVEKPAGFFSILIEVLANLVAGILVFFLTLPFLNFSKLPNNIYLSFFFLPLGLVFLHPKVFSRLLNFGLRILKKKSIEIELKYSLILSVVFFYFILWFLVGFSLFLLSKSIYPLGWGMLLPFTAIYAISWVIGFLSFITPAGLGVREGVFTFLLSAYVPVPIAIILSILTRVVITVAEVAAALFLVKKKYFL